mgnify:CR=1 FL=1|jgi:hypothetical protein
MRPLNAVAKSLVLLVVAAFCLFGYAASFESTGRPGLFLAFRVGYAVIGLGSLAGIVALVATFLRRTSGSDR